ncbi:hypothetical protein BT63DRAFT_439800 [Microthyrium microscopicum]|uniref:SRR1-like domain-containing protein n=1 Tax=Microthyrium microscopicum TaxID=703497 RepID=A0A6A6UAT0_9PEZI|nr:hypothetical protein BT63DRAFT_439800 [Microthyrium microscopicum]
MAAGNLLVDNDAILESSKLTTKHRKALEHVKCREAEAQKQVERIRKLYATGKPMYPRSAMLDAARQIKLGSPKITIRGWDDDVQEYEYLMPHERKDSRQRWRPILYWEPFQNMVKECLLMGHTPRPLKICYHSDSPHGTPEPTATIEELKETFKMRASAWRETAMAHKLRSQLQAMSTLPTKIVGFGLGSPSHSMLYDDGTKDDAPVCGIFAQHAAVVMIAEILKQKNGKAPVVLCQDPAYTENDKELLESNGIMTIESPMGFLEVDQSSVVITVSPNVPVKQIIADDRDFWPAALICNKIYSAEHEAKMYKRRDAYFTDPNGDRVRNMVQEAYSHCLLPSSNEFGGLPIEVYTRKVNALI